MRIPRYLHQIWIGPEPLPTEALDWMLTWGKHHPDFRYTLWTDRNLPPLRHPDLFAKSESWAQKADVLRYQILLELGGIYVDIDFECLQPVTPLLHDLDFFAAHESDKTEYCSIGILGAVPHHPVFQCCDHALRGVDPASGPAHDVTGPRFFRDSLHQAQARHGITPRIFPKELFYPSPPYEQGPVAPYAVHHYLASWVTPEIRALWTSTEPAQA